MIEAITDFNTVHRVNSRFGEVFDANDCIRPEWLRAHEFVAVPVLLDDMSNAEWRAILQRLFMASGQSHVLAKSLVPTDVDHDVLLRAPVEIASVAEIEEHLGIFHHVLCSEHGKEFAATFQPEGYGVLCAKEAAVSLAIGGDIRRAWSQFEYWVEKHREFPAGYARLRSVADLKGQLGTE